MFFILRAFFWIAVVAAFVPAGFAADQNGAFAREARAIFAAPTQTGFETAQVQADEFCATQSQACAVVEQFGVFGKIVSDVAVTRAERALHSRLNETEAPGALDVLIMEFDAADSSRL